MILNSIYLYIRKPKSASKELRLQTKSFELYMESEHFRVRFLQRVLLPAVLMLYGDNEIHLAEYNTKVSV